MKLGQKRYRIEWMQRGKGKSQKMGQRAVKRNSMPAALRVANEVNEQGKAMGPVLVITQVVVRDEGDEDEGKLIWQSEDGEPVKVTKERAG